jgi:hypothetical protein
MRYFFIVCVITCQLLFGCNKGSETPQPAISLPTLSTGSVTNITINSASSGGNISDDGGASVTARGVCWGNATGPTISGSHTTDGSGIGSFTSSITGLIPNTNYYLRAYATNSAGTAYGNQQVFTTSVANANVYVAGLEKNAAGKYVAKVWKNNIPTDLTNGNFDGWAGSVYVSGTDVYVCGYEVNAAGFRVAKYWKNGVTTALTAGTTNAEAWSIFVSGADVYAAGYEKPASGASVARYWKNGVATTLSSSIAAAYCTSIFVSGGNVYVTGAEGNASGKLVAKLWTNGTATDLSNSTTDAVAWSVYVLGGDVYVAGEVNDAALVSHAKYWKNGTGFDLVNGSNCEGRSIFATATDIYVAGVQVSNQARFWQNNVSTNLTPIVTFGHAASVYVLGNDVYVAGVENNFARLWKNGIATALTDGTRAGYALAVFVTP